MAMQRDAVNKCFQEHYPLLRLGNVNSEKSRGTEVVRWGLPRPGRVKCFVDYASANDDSAVMVVIFDEDGLIKCFRAVKVQVYYVLHGELEALKFGFCLAWDVVAADVDFYSNSLQLVQALVESQRPH
uniref:RNase H type-1 domain-containing protein n=1 Tax=Cannabis sativa TaxID=3483 RepID=A0A803NQH9_CANSA